MACDYALDFAACSLCQVFYYDQLDASTLRSLSDKVRQVYQCIPDNQYGLQERM